MYVKIEQRLYYGPSLEYSLCRYNYVNLIRKDLQKLKLTEIEIDTLIQSDIRNISYSILQYDDIILSKTKNFYLNNNSLSSKIKSIFKHYTKLFYNELSFLLKNPYVITKEDKDNIKLYVIPDTTNYKNAPILFINKKTFFRLIYLFLKINKGISIDKSIIINDIYHLLLLYNTINVKWSNIIYSKDINYNLIASPIMKILPFTYTSFFPFIEESFGSLGFYKSDIILNNDLIINIYNLNKYILKDINIYSQKKTSKLIIFHKNFKNSGKYNIVKYDKYYNKEIINEKLNYKIIIFK